MATVVDMLTKALAFTAYLNAAYPGMLVERYQSAAFDYTTGPNGVVLTGINKFWAKV